MAYSYNVAYFDDVPQSGLLRRKALPLRSLPALGQQLIEPVGGAGGDASEYFGEPGRRVDAVHLGSDDEAIHGDGSAPSAVGPAEQPRHSARRPPFGDEIRSKPR